MSAGTSLGSRKIKRSGSEEELQQARKRKRKESNRESARRSRLKKQRHMDDLTAQVAQLRDENRRIQSRVDVTTQVYLHIEAENSVLRAQLAELAHRVSSIDEIIRCLNPHHSADYFDRDLLAEEKILAIHDDDHHHGFIMMNDNHIHHHYYTPCEAMCLNQPIMDVFMC